MTQPENEIHDAGASGREASESSNSLDLLTTLFENSDQQIPFSNEESDLAVARSLVAEYFALGKQEGENLKKLMASRVGYKSMILASSGSGAAGGVIANFVSPQQLAATAGGAIGTAVAGPVGAVAGYAVGNTIGALPGVQTTAHALMGAMSGFLLGSAVYMLQATRTKWVSLKKFRTFMDYDLFKWENQCFRTQSVQIQAGVEILAQYLKAKYSGKFGNTKLLLISWRNSENGFYLANAYVKVLFMLLLSIDKMPSSVILSILNYVEKELESEQISAKLPSDFKKVYQSFKDKITKYVENRVYSETIVENLGSILLSGSSAITPIMPWIYSSLLGTDQELKFYDSDDFIKRIENDSVKSVSYRIWSDLSILKVNEIKDSKDLRLESLEKKIGKISTLINELNKVKLNSNGIEEIPNDDSVLKVEKKVNKLFEYAHDFLKHNFNNKDKQLEKIISLTHQLVKLEDPKQNSVSFAQNVWDKMFEWWNSQHKINEKASESSSKLYNGLIKINSEQKILTKDEFKNVVNICFAIKREFDKNTKLKEKYSQEFSKNEQNKKREFVFARKIDSFCELVLYVERVSTFMLKDDKLDKLSVYSFFGLWSVYNIVLNKYSVDIPDEVLRSFQDKNLANNFNSDEKLKRYFLMPYESFSKFLLPGFKRDYFNKNSSDFFRLYLFYLSNLINLVSEIQYHTEALKFSKLLMAMYGEEDTSVFFAMVPLSILKDRTELLLSMMNEFSNHVESLNKSYLEEKNSSWSNMIGLYDFLFGKNTGFYQNFTKRYTEYKDRVVIFKRNIDYSLSLLEQKSRAKNETKPINENLARNTDKFFKYSLDLFLKYLKSVNSNTKDKNYSEKLELQIMDLQERHESFISDKALMLGVIPTFKVIESNSTDMSNDQIHSFIMSFFKPDKFKIPFKAYEISKKQNAENSISQILKNFLNSDEAKEILKECIEKIRDSSYFKSFGYNFYKRNSLFDITRNDYMFESAEIRISSLAIYFSKFEKTTNIQLLTNHEHANASQNENLKLLKDSGLADINLEIENVENESKNQAYLTYLLFFSFAMYPANHETILESFYSSSNSDKEKLAFIQSVWGLFGLFLAYMFDGTREKYQKISYGYQQEKVTRKIEEAQIASVKDKNLSLEKKKFLQEKIEYKNQMELERNALEQTQTSTYAKISLGIQAEILRLENTDKGKFLKSEFEKIDRENSINLINKLSKVLNQQRNFFSFGATKSYTNIMTLAQKNGISQMDLAKEAAKEKV
ncbi:glycine zipper family protein [Pigmentibacter ruber]|uniref:glycine zipper family protein n=1 Tax=Pigmentibacter ruber TaxID=2683196 RepID=UPI00131E2CF0|nr:glycine zipper family protein [Pigmentibacter ruber]